MYFRIPRDEVKEMNEVVMYELNAILKGCTSTIHREIGEALVFPVRSDHVVDP